MSLALSVSLNDILFFVNFRFIHSGHVSEAYVDRVSSLVVCVFAATGYF